jgi:hypothetical protein
MLTKSRKRVNMKCKHRYQVRIGYEEGESFKGDMYQLEVKEIYECMDCNRKVTV